ncbi:MAG: hypothetical protein LCH44_11130, partial [Bacteroidetes bacterium]|nr:hypothetical protein [Bacteroidota bacterium]
TCDSYYYAEGYFKVNSGGDLTISNYPNTRVDAIMPKNYLCTGTSGQVYSRPTSDFGSFAHTWGSSDITLTSSPGASWSSFPFPAGNNYVNIDSIYSVNGAGVIVIPSVIKYHKIEVTFYWETTSGTSGTPTIEIRCQVNGVNVAANPIFQCKPTATGTPIQLSWITPSTGNVVIGARVIAGPSCYIKTRNLIVEDKGFAPG